jgi:hypothetical protein
MNSGQIAGVEAMISFVMVQAQRNICQCAKPWNWAGADFDRAIPARYVGRMCGKKPKLLKTI